MLNLRKMGIISSWRQLVNTKLIFYFGFLFFQWYSIHVKNIYIWKQ